jgi:hypothetical protein
MKTNYKKTLKLITLLITSILIATVSAQLYDKMYMKAIPIGVEGVAVKFTSGNETTAAGGSINTPGTEVTFDNMKGKPGVEKVYGQAVNITNTNSTYDFKIELELDSWTGAGHANLTCINVTIYDDAGSKQGTTINLVPAESGATTTSELTIPASKVWSVEWVILWEDTAVDTDTVDVTLALIVKE